MTAKSITKADFNKGLQGIKRAIKGLEIRLSTDIKNTNTRIEAVRSELKGDIQIVNVKVDNFRLELKDDIKRVNVKLDNTRLELKDDIRQVIAHFNVSQGAQNKRFDRIDSKLESMNFRFNTIDARLDAIAEMLATRKEMRNLIRELKSQGIKLEEARIFV